MKKRYNEEQIIKAIKRHESAVKVEAISRELGISIGTFYNWRSKYAGLEVNLVGLSRNANRYKRKSPKDKVLRERMKSLASEYPRYGYLMLDARLHAEGLVTNKKRT